MARRKRKQQDYLSQFSVLLITVGFLAGFYYTQSFIVGGFIALMLFMLMLAIAFGIGKRNRDRLKRSGIAEIDKMDGHQFEHYLGLLFKSQGYKVEVTRSTGDFGADLVLQKAGKRIVVQAKRHSKNVGISAVQEAQAAIAYYKAQEAWVVSNRYYTDPAIRLAADNHVQLIDRNKLIEMVLKMNPDAVPDPSKVRSEVQRLSEKCKVCGKEMVVRRGAKGEFLGCSGFPQCRHTKSLTS